MYSAEYEPKDCHTIDDVIAACKAHLPGVLKGCDGEEVRKNATTVNVLS